MTQHNCGSNGCGHASNWAVHNESAMLAGPCDCKGANCGATDGRHSRECIAEAGTAQGWNPTAADYASCGPSRVTPADIEAEIVGEHYFTAAQGTNHPQALNPRDFGDVPAGLAMLTFCVLRLRNCTKLVGHQLRRHRPRPARCRSWPEGSPRRCHGENLGAAGLPAAG